MATTRAPGWATRENLVRQLLRGRPVGELDRPAVHRGVVAALAAALAATAASALPPVSLPSFDGLRIVGADWASFTGHSVSGAGDVNGDGLDDVIVGAPRAELGTPGPGAAYVVFGTATPSTIQLEDVFNGVGGFAMSGTFDSDEAGTSVSGAGDVNGDGLDDVLVGAPHASGSRGFTFVVFGKADGAHVALSDVLDGIGGFAIRGIDAGDLSGNSVSGAGDVNGDGLADVIVGAFMADPGGRSSAGESYVVFGKADTSLVLLSQVVVGNGGFVINGADPVDFSGISVSGAGDVDGDGTADVIVGARNAGGFTGKGYVVFGKADGAPVELSDVAEGTGGFAMCGIDPGDQCGQSVAGAGDVNADGRGDLIVGAPLADVAGVVDAGESYVVFGKPDGAPVDLADVASGTGGFIISGIQQGDRAGNGVSGAGDTNGDGRADLIVGAVGAGEAYVVFGKPDGDPVALASVVAGLHGFAMINGPPTTGSSVSAAGDVNADGLADVIVGAEGSGNGGAYVVFSPAPACFEVLDEQVVCHDDGEMFTYTAQGVIGCTGAVQSFTFTGSADAPGQAFCFTVVVSGEQSGYCCTTLLCGEVPDCGEGASPYDLDGDGAVGAADLLALLASWGSCTNCAACPASFDADCTVGTADLLMLLGNWGT